MNAMTRRRKRTHATFFLPVVLCLGLLRPASAAPGSWSQTADLPSRAAGTTAGVVDGILYVIGGCYPYTNPLATVWASDPATDSWTNKAPLPTTRWFAAAAVVDGIIYVVGGKSGSWPGTAVLPVAAYNPRTDTWTNGANMLAPRSALAACAVDGMIYAIGGSYGGAATSTVQAYDPTNNVWTTKSPLPQPLRCLAASVVNGQIYAFCGTSTFAYDPQANRWTTKAPYSPYSWGLMSSAVDGIIYLYGGWTADLTGCYDLVWAYDPAQDQFTPRRKMPRTRSTAGCVVIDGKTYLAGGPSKEPIVNPDAIYYTVVDVVDPQGGVTPQILSLTCESTNQVRLVWQGEAGMKYGVESRPNAATGAWTRVTFTSGTNSVLATNALVEATCIVPTVDTNRFFRVLEVN